MAADPASVAQSVSSVSWISIFGGALIGSTISGLINIALHWRTINKSVKHREEDRKEKRIALAFSLFVKLYQIETNSKAFFTGIEEKIREAEDDQTKHPTLAVVSYLNNPEKVSFTTDELGLTASFGTKLFNDIHFLDQRNDLIISLIVEYREKRGRIFERIEGKFPPGTVIFEYLSAEDRDWCKIRLEETDKLVKHSREIGEETHSLAKKAREQWLTVMSKEFGLTWTLEEKERVQG